MSKRLAILGLGLFLVFPLGIKFAKAETPADVLEAAKTAIRELVRVTQGALQVNASLNEQARLGAEQMVQRVHNAQVDAISRSGLIESLCKGVAYKKISDGGHRARGGFSHYMYSCAVELRGFTQQLY